MKARGPLTGRVVLTVAALAAAVASVLLLTVPGSLGAYVARVSNPGNTVSTNPWFTCRAAALGDAATIVYPLNDSSVLAGMADVSGNGRNGSYSLLGVSYRQPGPCGRDSGLGITLNGSTGFAYGPATTFNPSTFSEEIWFKTAVGGGKLMGFGNSLNGTSSQFDRHVYLSNTGNVVFGVYPNPIKVVVSPSTYLDNAWHHVVATQAGSTNVNPGIRLYVDGALVASDSTVTTNENANEYWRIGYDNLANWGTTTPTNYYYTGSLAWAALYATTALTPAQVRAHYTAGTG